MKELRSLDLHNMNVREGSIAMIEALRSVAEERRWLNNVETFGFNWHVDSLKSIFEDLPKWAMVLAYEQEYEDDLCSESETAIEIFNQLSEEHNSTIVAEIFGDAGQCFVIAEY